MVGVRFLLSGEQCNICCGQGEAISGNPNLPPIEESIAVSFSVRKPYIKITVFAEKTTPPILEATCRPSIILRFQAQVTTWVRPVPLLLVPRLPPRPKAPSPFGSPSGAPGSSPGGVPAGAPGNQNKKVPGGLPGGFPSPSPPPNPGPTPQPNKYPGLHLGPALTRLLMAIRPAPGSGIGPAPSPNGVPKIGPSPFVSPPPVDPTKYPDSGFQPKIFTPNPLSPNPLTPSGFAPSPSPKNPNQTPPSPFVPNPKTGDPEPKAPPLIKPPTTPAPTHKPDEDIVDKIENLLVPIGIGLVGITNLVQPEKLREAANAASCESFAPWWL